MSEDRQIELWRALTAAQGKYCYFLLAASGTMIGFAITQTNDSYLSFSKWPLGVAVFLWGLSFYLGLKALTYTQGAIRGNFTMLKILRGQEPTVGTHPERIFAASAGAAEGTDWNATRVGRFSKWQFRTLVLGALFFLIWHTYEMYLRIPS